MSVGDVVRLIKTNTTSKIKEKFPILKKHYWVINSLWSEGYFVSTTGITTNEIIKRYIANQGELEMWIKQLRCLTRAMHRIASNTMWRQSMVVYFL